MTRPYIRSPLEAALAGRNHKITFISRSGNNLFCTIGDGELAWYEEFITENRVFNERYIYEEFYISPESLPLLNPTDHDIGIDNSGYPVFFLDGRWRRYNLDADFVDGDVIIIRRNDKPFPRIDTK